MPKVKGKEHLCSCEKKYFKSIQGIGEHTLFERFNDIENVVNNSIDAKFSHFLAQPIVEGETIHWFSKPFNETPFRLNELQGQEYQKYQQIKDETLSHYRNIINVLNNNGKNDEAKSLENAIKFVNDDFVFCFDNKTVLGIWGMQLKDNIRESVGIVVKNQFVAKPKPEFKITFVAGEPGILAGSSEFSKKKGDVINEKEVPTVTPLEGYEFTRWDKDPNNFIVLEDTVFIAQYNNPNQNGPFLIRFNAGNEGYIESGSELTRHSGENIISNEIPKVIPKEGFEFTGWDKNPEGYSVSGNVEFNAQYKPSQLKPYIVSFIPGDTGTVTGNSEFQKHAGQTISANEIPKIEPKKGYEFKGWDKDPNNFQVNGDTVFTAQYKPVKLPWYKRFWNWLRAFFVNNGCLRWLLWLLLLLLIILIFLWLFRKCDRDEVITHDKHVVDKPWVDKDPRVHDGGGIYDPGNPYNPVPTPPEYEDVLPPYQGVLPPFDTTKIIRDPGNPSIVGNRLNVLMENEDKSILDLAKAFKEKYPGEQYKVVYYDDVIKRMQIEVPTKERIKIKKELPSKFAPEYKLFVFDEALFEGVYSPNDPAFKDQNKAWFLKAVNAPQAWEITKGTYQENTTTIAVVDNGFSLNHPEFKNKVVMPYNVWKHSRDISANRIDHGTHVAGIALANADNGKGLCGVAPESKFMPVQVATSSGFMTTTSVLDGVIYSLYQGADVVNVSLGIQFNGHLSDQYQREIQNNHFKEEERLWKEVMEIADEHKAVVVVASGNENMLAGVNPMNRPRNFVIVSAVGKSSGNYQKADFSNYGEYSTVSAPGVDIYSSYGNNNYVELDGTSMAAPIVTGAVALMKSIDKNLSASQVICILKATGLTIKGNVGNFIQIDKALNKIKSGDIDDCKNETPVPTSGDVQVLLNWNNYNDLDIMCVDPNLDTVSYRKKIVQSGGMLEIDMNVSPSSKEPIENIYWPTGEAPKGKYKILLSYFRRHEKNIDETPYKITIKYGNKTKEINGIIRKKDKTISIFSFVLAALETDIRSAYLNHDNAVFQIVTKITLQEQNKSSRGILTSLKNNIYLTNSNLI